VSSPIEVEQVWARDGEVEIVATLAGERELRRPEGVLVLRERPEITMARPARRREPGLSVTYSAEDLARACPDGGGCWDAYLEADAPGGRVRMRMGRHRDDIADKRKVMVYPGQLVPGHEGDVVVRPRYTVSNNVSIDCVPHREPRETP
jgi:hypothetical protein